MVVCFILRNQEDEGNKRERLGGEVSKGLGDNKCAIERTSRLWEGLEIKDSTATVKNCQKCNVAF